MPCGLGAHVEGFVSGSSFRFAALAMYRTPPKVTTSFCSYWTVESQMLLYSTATPVPLYGTGLESRYATDGWMYCWYTAPKFGIHRPPRPALSADRYSSHADMMNGS